MVNLGECRKVAEALREFERHIANGDPGDSVKKLLTISATVIEQLTCETERYRKEALQDDDPYKPLWPNWEE